MSQMKVSRELVSMLYKVMTLMPLDRFIGWPDDRAEDREYDRSSPEEESETSSAKRFE